MHRAGFTIPCTSGRAARILMQSVEVESADGPEGTTTMLRSDDECLFVDIVAQDLSGLRAAAHSVLRLLDAARRSVESSD